MEQETFLHLPNEDVAHIVREAGQKVCVFPINGTRRWLMLEHPEAVAEDFVEAYLNIAGRRHVEPDRLGLKGFFDLPQLDPANDMAGHHIHGLYAGTAGRTLAALVAGQEVLLA